MSEQGGGAMHACGRLGAVTKKLRRAKATTTGARALRRLVHALPSLKSQTTPPVVPDPGAPTTAAIACTPKPTTQPAPGAQGTSNLSYVQRDLQYSQTPAPKATTATARADTLTYNSQTPARRHATRQRAHLAPELGRRPGG